MKKLREENEISDLMIEECRSCSESSGGGSSIESHTKSQTKWHSAEDVRKQKVLISFFFPFYFFAIIFCATYIIGDISVLLLFFFYCSMPMVAENAERENDGVENKNITIQIME